MGRMTTIQPRGLCGAESRRFRLITVSVTGMGLSESLSLRWSCLERESHRLTATGHRRMTGAILLHSEEAWMVMPPI